ncbi:hypothetical protein T440DRAFT_462913 [Plenodomus tracheiphilus IPT5]|uniref:Uncharacterized protein n=1 Tax=Plenodomus tracheiphilus IPT5 TaxID=1408161 RepID=A0A6A7BMH8_9PLEO|nr:hypothetical protein T440DRAFT_462913 [Plenodomus tracheiphilus IPT5]
MSVTTTANPLTYQISHVLADYELTHSHTPNNEIDTSLNSHPNPSSQSQNPSDWPTEHRRVPEYRPVNTELDQSERRVYQNGAERVFIALMFTGVFSQSTASKIWRNSLGRVWNVGYKLGGEW